MAGLVPVFFLPFTIEYFALNKLAVIFVATVLLILTFSIKFIRNSKNEFVKSPLDLPLGILAVVLIISTLFSRDMTSSIFGGYVRWTGIATVLILFAYYFISTGYIKTKEDISKILGTLGVSSAIATAWALLSYYGVSIPGIDVTKSAIFNPIGAQSNQALLAGFGFITLLGLITNVNKTYKKVILAILASINFYYFILTGGIMAIAFVVAASLGVVLWVGPSRLRKEQAILAALAGVMIAIILVVSLPATKQIVINSNYIMEPKLSFQDSWIVSAATIQSFPLFGTGPETFYADYTAFKPVRINMTDMWNLRLDKPYNEFLNVLATTGVIGLVALLFLSAKVMKVVGAVRKSEDETPMTGLTTALLFGLGVSFLFGYFTVVNGYLFFTILALTVAAHSMSASSGIAKVRDIRNANALNSIVSFEGKADIDFARVIVGAAFIAITGYISYIGVRSYIAEVYFAMGTRMASALDFQNGINYQVKAIRTNGSRSQYYNGLVGTYLRAAMIVSSKENASEEDKKLAIDLLTEAIRTSTEVTEVINPLSAVNWETRAQVYSTLLGAAQNADQWAIAAYNEAIARDPNNPTLRMSLGNIYIASEQVANAATQFKTAADLKPDYANAHYNLGYALLDLNDIQGAVSELAVARATVPQDSEDFAKVDKEIKELIQKYQEAAQTKPTVEQLEGTPTETVQEPLTNNQPPALPENLDLGTIEEVQAE